MENAILLCYHGSKNLDGRRDTKKLTKIFEKKINSELIKYGYLQNAKPNISSQISLLLKKKIKKITIIPGMLFPGNHVVKDIPKIVNKFKKKNLKINIHPPLISLKGFFRLIQKNIHSKIRTIRKDNKTCLILIASNTLNKIAISQMNIILKKISARYHIKNSKIIMIGSKSTFLKKKLLELNKEGISQFIIVPLLLFRGELLKNCINVTNYFKDPKKKINCILLPHLKNYNEISNYLIKSLSL